MTTLALNPKTLDRNRFLSEGMATNERFSNLREPVKEEIVEQEPEPSVIENLLNQIHKSPSFNKIVDGVSLSSISALTLSAFVNKHFFKVPENLSKFLYNFGDISNKVFQALNSVKNIAKLYPNKDYVNSLGHLADFFLPFIYKMKDFYLSRGLSLGLYGGANALNIIGKKANFKSEKEYFDHVKNGLSKSFENFFSNPKEFFKNFFRHDKAMTGIFASSLCLSGFVLWKPLELMFGKVGRVITALLRDSGGFLTALELMKPGHLRSGKIFLGLSGYSQFLGAAFNLLAESAFNKYKEILDPLSFAFSNLGRWLLSISYAREETGIKN